MIEGYKVINNLGEEEIIHIPYNINNILVTEKDLIKLFNHFNIKIDKINNIEIFREAFTHKSYCKTSIYPEQVLIDAKNEIGNPPDLIELRTKSYETLEYLGDRVLKLVVSAYLKYRYPEANEGFLTRLQSKIEDKSNLSMMSKEVGLGKFFIISKNIEMANGRLMERIHEDIFESFLGALYLSNGHDVCFMYIVNLLETLIDYSEKLYCDNNYKDILLRYHHSQDWTHPKYDIVYQEGPAHKKKYIIGVLSPNKNDENIRNNYIGYGVGNSHKEGAQHAAKMALIIYGVLKDDQYTQSDIYYPEWNKIDNDIELFQKTKVSENDTNILNTQTLNAQTINTVSDTVSDAASDTVSDTVSDTIFDDAISVCSDKSI